MALDTDLSADLDRFRTIEELAHHQGEVIARMKELDGEYAGKPMDDTARSEFVSLHETNKLIDSRSKELQARKDVLASLESRDGNTERHRDVLDREIESQRGTTRDQDIYDLTTIRSNLMDPSTARRELRSRALRSLETATFPHYRGNPDNMKTHVQRLLDNQDSEDGEIARRMLITGSPTYKRAFMKYVFGRPRTTEEERALALGAGGTGGFAVVYTLDPTFIPTSNLSVNPFRGISSVETISGTNEWRGVTTQGVTASYGAEAAETTDNSPALLQPDITVQRATVFVPVAIELTQDLPSLQGSLANLIQDAKDDLEATQFTSGVGTTVYPQGILVGASTQVLTAGTAAFAVGDAYSLEGQLGARFRSRAVWVANRTIYGKVRQFDTSGGASMWVGYPNPLQGGLENNVPSGGNTGLTLIGYPTYEDSAMPTGLTSGNKIAVLGDFRYYKIIDRIGMDIEVIPHIFGTARGFPTGQRGVFAMWRNSARVLDPNAFRVLVTT